MATADEVVDGSRIAENRARSALATLRSRLEALDRQCSVNGRRFGLGNASSNDIHIGPGGATFAAKVGAIRLDGDLVRGRALGDTVIKGSKIGGN